MKFGKAGTLVAAAAVAVSMLSSMPVFASSELNFGTGFTPQTVTHTQQDTVYENIWTDTSDLHGYNQSPELFLAEQYMTLYNNVYAPIEGDDSVTQSVKTNKSGLLTKIVVNRNDGEGGPNTTTTTYKYNKKGDLLKMHQTIVLEDDNFVVDDNTIVFHYNKDYTLNYISGVSNMDPTITMVCQPVRNESGTIIGFSRVNNYADSSVTTDASFTFNPDGTIAAITQTETSTSSDPSLQFDPSTTVFTFAYENGRLAAYQETSDSGSDTYVFGY